MPPVNYGGEIHILQHPTEQHHSKNTVRLVKLLLPQVQVWLGESEQELAPLQNYIKSSDKPWGCIYPSCNSLLFTEASAPLPKTNLLFIDATWRKARKIWHLNPWLAALHCYHLPDTRTGAYRIRKNHAPHQLSTLEAIAVSLSQAAETAPLLDLFEQFQRQVEGFKAAETE